MQERTTDRFWTKAMDFVLGDLRQIRECNWNCFCGRRVEVDMEIEFGSWSWNCMCMGGPDDCCKSVIKMLHSRSNYSVTSPSRRAYMNITRILALSYMHCGLLVWPGKKLLESLPEVTNSVCTVHTLILNWTAIITVMRSNSAVITNLLCSSMHAEWNWWFQSWKPHASAD